MTSTQKPEADPSYIDVDRDVGTHEHNLRAELHEIPAEPESKVTMPSPLPSNVVELAPKSDTSALPPAA